MPRRTKEDAQATREQLLDAAERLFMAQGLARTTLADIAAEAGLTRGAIYWHFADKAALVNALVDRVDLPMEQALQAAEQDRATDPIARLRSLAMAPFALMQQDPRAQRVFVILLHRSDFSGELADVHRRSDGAMDDCICRMERLFEQARDAGRLRAATTPRAAATAMIALVDGLLRLATSGAPATPDLQPTVAAAVDALLAGLADGGPGTARTLGGGPSATPARAPRRRAPARAAKTA